MARLIAVASRALADARRNPGAPDLTEAELGRAFEKVYVQAVAEAGIGRTVTQVEQLQQAGRMTGRDPSTGRYMEDLERVVRETPFQSAPGALEILQGLRADGYQLGIVSNTVGEPGRFLRPVLQAMGFDRYVQTFVFSDEHPWTKPSPEIFRAALDDLREPPERSVHVGDNWDDLEGARRAGLRAGILFTGLHSYSPRYEALFRSPGRDRPVAEYEVNHLHQVLQLVRELVPL